MMYEAIYNLGIGPITPESAGRYFILMGKIWRVKFFGSLQEIALIMLQFLEYETKI